MKTFLIPIACASMIATGVAQNATETAKTNAANAPISSVGASARDGFTIAGTELYVTRNGVTEKLLKEVTMPTGLRVGPDGSIVLPDGTKTSLRANQILTFDGQLQDAAITPAGVAPITTAGVPSANVGAEVGRAARDGVTVTGNEAFITRNGVMEKITGETRLKNGAIVEKDGTIRMPNGNKITLRTTQIMTLDGVLMEAPVKLNPPSGTGARSEPLRGQ